MGESEANGIIELVHVCRMDERSSAFDGIWLIYMCKLEEAAAVAGAALTRSSVVGSSGGIVT